MHYFEMKKNFLGGGIAPAHAPTLLGAFGASILALDPTAFLAN